jgi:DNA-binding NarL/FixJ family response regulator
VNVQTLRTKAWRQPTSQPAGFTLAAISDDETLARRAATALEGEGMIVMVEAAGPDVSALEDLDSWPDLVLVRRAPNRGGLERALLWTQRRLAGTMRIVVLPAPEAVDLGGLLAAGAQGIVQEQDLERTLGPVVRAVATGHICVPAEMRHAIEPPALSHRERQVLALAVAGLTNAQIAERVYLSESTVKTHLTSAFRQLGVHSRREAASLVRASDGALRRTVLVTLGSAETAASQEGL